MMAFGKKIAYIQFNFVRLDVLRHDIMVGKEHSF